VGDGARGRCATSHGARQPDEGFMRIKWYEGRMSTVAGCSPTFGSVSVATGLGRLPSQDSQVRTAAVEAGGAEGGGRLLLLVLTNKDNLGAHGGGGGSGGCGGPGGGPGIGRRWSLWHLHHGGSARPSTSNTMSRGRAANGGRAAGRHRRHRRHRRCWLRSGILRRGVEGRRRRRARRSRVWGGGGAAVESASPHPVWARRRIAQCGRERDQRRRRCDGGLGGLSLVNSGAPVRQGLCPAAVMIDVGDNHAPLVD